MRAFLLAMVIMGLGANAAWAQDIRAACPDERIAPRGRAFSPDGILLTYFDGASLWVYDINRATRYPLPETRPCVGNCRLSPDARWITYLNPDTLTYHKMRVTGVLRTPITAGAADIIWWDEGVWLVWTPDHRAYLMPENGTPADRRYLPTRGVLSIQPRGYAAVWLGQQAGGVFRYLIDLERVTAFGAVVTPLPLAPDLPYFNGMGWSPDGRYLAFVGLAPQPDARGVVGAELFLVDIPAQTITQATDFTGGGMAVRLNGADPSTLSWSPDSTRVAFWAMPLLSSDPTQADAATLHVYDVRTGDVRRYCGFSTREHTPNPPRLAWSPDGSTLAFGGNVEGDGKGYLLLTLNTETGAFTELSDGIFPALGAPDVLAWGIP